MPSPAKLQRWTDLLAALLKRRYPATLIELARDVPAYALPKGASETAKQSMKRTFERDKKELLAFGIPIETIGKESCSLRPGAFYMPYLALLRESGRTTPPRRVDAYGYHSLQQMAFEPDELAAIAAAIERVQQLGEPLLAANARSAGTKLAFDIPEALSTPRAEHVITRDAPRPAVFSTLNQALLAHKTVSFVYQSMSQASTGRRSVQPLGLFFLNSHWYLAARDAEDAQVKNYRLSRMSAVKANTAAPTTPDFSPPADFSLRDHAQSRQAWELGEADTIEAIVEFTSHTGAVSPALELGRTVPGHDGRRAFTIRRQDPFVRWLLSFGGAARPISPPALVAAFRRTIAETLAQYEGRT